jgi:hypothetical protein
MRINIHSNCSLGLFFLLVQRTDRYKQIGYTYQEGDQVLLGLCIRYSS